MAANFSHYASILRNKESQFACVVHALQTLKRKFVMKTCLMFSLLVDFWKNLKSATSIQIHAFQEQQYVLLTCRMDGPVRGVYVVDVETLPMLQAFDFPGNLWEQHNVHTSS
mmetsp:Transcript_16748/g.24761  ORF Transcript_16748/g.24761 Transcript_16748/m.24761 type:complete len:112 (-) Transcript_16748:777-1112(-)